MIFPTNAVAIPQLSMRNALHLLHLGFSCVPFQLVTQTAGPSDRATNIGALPLTAGASMEPAESRIP